MLLTYLLGYEIGYYYYELNFTNEEAKAHSESRFEPRLSNFESMLLTNILCDHWITVFVSNFLPLNTLLFLILNDINTHLTLDSFLFSLNFSFFSYKEEINIYLKGFLRESVKLKMSNAVSGTWRDSVNVPPWRADFHSSFKTTVYHMSIYRRLQVK